MTDSDGNDSSDDSGTPPAPVMPLTMVSAPIRQQILPPPTPVAIGQDGFNQAYQNVLAHNPIGARIAAISAGSIDDYNKYFGGNNSQTTSIDQMLRDAHPSYAYAGDVGEDAAKGLIGKGLIEGALAVPGLLAEVPAGYRAVKNSVSPVVKDAVEKAGTYINKHYPF